MTGAEFVEVCTLSAIPDGGAIRVVVDEFEVALFRHGTTVRALDDRCTHEGAPLSQGIVEDDTVLCPWHGAAFSLDSGRNTSPPAPHPVRCWEVRVSGDAVEIRRLLAR